jgi:hypothetical protein
MVKFLMDEGVQMFFEFIYPDMLNTWKRKLTKASALLDAETEIEELLKDTDRKESYTGFQQRKSVLPEGITHKKSHHFRKMAENKDMKKNSYYL